MQKLFLLFTTLLSIIIFNLEAKETVLVSVSPHKFFVEQIAGDTVDVLLMVPAGASAHTYEPTPKQMMEASKAAIWFFIGESFETKAMATLKSYRPEIRLIDLRENVDLISGEGCCQCHANAADLHFWLSPREAKKQAETIYKELVKAFPENSQDYKERYHHFTEKLATVDRDMQKMFQHSSQKLVLVSHPAYAYLCRDYGLKQLSIECEGKDPTPQQLTNILNSAKKAEVKKVFIQIQYGNKGARLIAEHLNAQLITLDPYSENYFESLKEIAAHFSS